MSKNNLHELEANLGYTFKDISLLEHSLRHRSSAGGIKSNERLEFLGDATLGLIIGLELYNQYPKVEEGKLSRFRSNLVNGEILAVLANDFEVGKYLLLGVGERKTGGAKRTSILSDAMEAIIGAIYLDSNFEITRQRVLSWYKPRWEEVLTAEQKDAKTRLQEKLQAFSYPLPTYKIVKIEGVSHKQTFYIECSVQGLDGKAEGVGSSKRRAEQEAADKFLELDVVKKLENN